MLVCPIAKREVVGTAAFGAGEVDSAIREKSGTSRGVRKNKGSQLVVSQQVASRVSFQAEGTGLAEGVFVSK